MDKSTGLNPRNTGRDHPPVRVAQRSGFATIRPRTGFQGFLAMGASLQDEGEENPYPESVIHSFSPTNLELFQMPRCTNLFQSKSA